MPSDAYRDPAQLPDGLGFLAGGGEATALILARDWTAHPLGRPDHWPEALKVALSTILNSPESMIISWGRGELSFFFNEAYFPLLGPRLSRAMGAPFREVWPDAWAQAEPIIDAAFAGRSQRFDDLPWKLGTDRGAEDTWFTFSYSRILDGTGAVAGLFIFTNETTERVKSDAALRISEERYRALFDAVDDGFCIIEFVDGPGGPMSDYVHVEANPGYQRHTGIADIVGKRLSEIAPGEEAGWLDLYGGVLRTGVPVRFERLFEAVGRHIEVSAARIEPASRRQVSVMFRDITPRRQAEDAVLALNETLEQRVAERTAELMEAEERLRQAQKMEAVGQLTGGLAHDFNNLLAGISGSLEIITTRLSQGRLADVDKYVVAAQGATRRAAALTHRLLAFSRRQTLDPRPTNVNALVTGMTDLIQRTVGPGIVVETVGAAALWPTLVDGGQLENALLNLAINARDAMPDGGRITIETANKWLDRGAARSHDMPEGQYLSLCVTDTGTGMTATTIDRAFEPFFTTKPLGQGTGLGLSMIYGFAKQSGGQVRIYSEVGQGTTVCIYLPRHYGEATHDGSPSADAVTDPVGAGETVLVVDDEPTVRMLVTDILEDFGYTVIEAGDSVAGLRLLRSNVRIDLLISDVGLPGGMNGRQMAEAGRQARPGLKVLFITGYAENSVIGNGHLEPGMQVLTKPFAVDTLAARIGELMTG